MPPCFFFFSTVMKRTLESFISDARKIHGDKYDYSKSVYKGIHSKLVITCPIHGDFEQRPNDHLHGQGCKECGKLTSASKRRLDTESFKKKFTELYGDSYDLSEFTYSKSNVKSTAICKLHGKFSISPNNLLNGRGCPLCGNKRKSSAQTLKEQVFNERIRTIYCDSISYDFNDYVNNATKMRFICKSHGEFESLPLNVMRGHGCPICGKIKYSASRTTKWNDALARMVSAHGDTYRYNESTYTSPKAKMEIICKKHGAFTQTPINHWSGQGCPICNESHLERELSHALSSNGIEFIRQRKIGKQFVDFYIPSIALNIECQGEQHFKKKFGDNYDFAKAIDRDIRKHNAVTSLGESIIYLTSKNLLPIDVSLGDLCNIYNDSNVMFSTSDVILHIASISSDKESKTSHTN